MTFSAPLEFARIRTPEQYMAAGGYCQISDSDNPFTATTGGLSAQFDMSADMLATLALNLDRIGKIKMAQRFYEAALRLDEGHFMARENLRKLTGSNNG